MCGYIREVFFARRRAVLNVQAPGSRALSVPCVKGGRAPSAVFRCAWTCIFLALSGWGVQVSAAPAVLVHFLPNYKLGDIEPKKLTVENNGWAPAEFKVQVLDHEDHPVKGEDVDWEVTGKGAEAVVWHSDKTDDQGWGRVWLTSRKEGTFVLKASWNNNEAQVAKPASVEFKETEALEIGKGETLDMPYKPDEGFRWKVTGGSKASISCASSDDNVLTAKAVNNDACEIRMKGSGSATLTVTQDETDQYQANSASCEITLKSQCQLLYASSVFLGQQRIVVTGGGANQEAKLYVNGNDTGIAETTDITGRAEFVLDVKIPDETLSIMVDVNGAKTSGEMRVQPYPMYAEPYMDSGFIKAKVTAQKLDKLGVFECPQGWVEDAEFREFCIKEDLMADASGVYVIDVNDEYSVKTKGRNIPASEAIYTMEQQLMTQAGSESLTLKIENSGGPPILVPGGQTGLASSYKIAILDSEDDQRRIEMDLNDSTPQERQWKFTLSDPFPRIKVSFPDKASFPKNKEIDIYPLLYDKTAATITGTFTKEVSLPMLKGFVINDAQ